MLKKFSFVKRNITKCYFFLSRAQNDHSFTFNSRFLQGVIQDSYARFVSLKARVGFSIFDFVSITF